MDGFQLPPRKKLSEFLGQEAFSVSGKTKNVFAKNETRPPRKGKCWTEEEHLAFLAGLKKLGKGNWTGISRYYVPTRTSTQIASHAQKYLQRVTGATKRKSRFSNIEEQVLTSSLVDEIQPVWPLPPSTRQAEPSGSGSCSTESPPACMPSARLREAEAMEDEGRAAKLQRLCKPTAVKASSSEPDLLKLAESLIGLSDPSRTFSCSQKSAFKRAGSAQALCKAEG